LGYDEKHALDKVLEYGLMVMFVGILMDRMCHRENLGRIHGWMFCYILLPLDPLPQNFRGVPYLKNFVVVESGVFAFFLAVC
jgi:hypothetical protein